MSNLKIRANYDCLIEKLKEMVEYYENSITRNNRIKMYLANGDVINYTVTNHNIAHLLGVNTQILISNKIVKSTDSYGALKELINDSYGTYNAIEKFNGFGSVFSTYIDDKIDAFKKQIDNPNILKYEFVCKYDRSKNYTEKKVDGLTADYYLASKDENDNIILLGLVRQNEEYDNCIYIPQTTRVIKEEQLYGLLNGQEITYVSKSVINNPYNGYTGEFIVKNIDTYRLLEILYSYQNMTGAIPNTIKNHIYQMKYLSKFISNNRIQSKELEIIFEKISYAISNNIIINLEEEELEKLDISIIELVKEHNDIHLSSSKVDLYSKGEFSKVVEDKDKYRKELENIKEVLQHQRVENEDLKLENEQLKEQLQKLQIYEQQFRLLFNQVNNIGTQINQTIEEIPQEIRDLKR
ncbi:MAG: hypothetical protein E7158_02290 [Firmicutes bacterium]|nr:hypothetical protein [Bacillota bacterium]